MSTDQERQTTTERERETFTRFFEGAEPRLRVALGAALGQDRGRDAASEALAYGWENWDRLQEMENLNAFFGDDVVYTSPNNVEFVGQTAATCWQRFLGETAVRKTRVFDLGDGIFGFDIDFVDADSGRATHRTALVEIMDGRISSLEED